MSTSAPTRTVADLSYLLTHAGYVLSTQMTAGLAEISDLDKTTMVVTIDELERAGLAERRPSGRDRRARIIAVTEAGERAVAEGSKIADQVHRGVLDALSREQADALVDALTELSEGYLAQPAESGPPVRRARQRRLSG